MQPGEALLTGQINGQQLGQVLFEFLPTMGPWESPIPLPRALARRLFPGGFQPFRAAPTMAPPVTLIPPAAPAAPVVPAPPAADANGNQIQRRQPVPAAAPRKRVLERGSFPAWH
ncbi:hypothetical protein ES705_39097 [subsurface metagenome]